MVKISFVVSAHNEETLLPQCLNSIKEEIERTACEAEILVVNNASTDRTKEIALAEGAKVVDELRKGLTHARQAGLIAASGELVANLDADIVMPEGWISIVLKEFGDDANLTALSGPFVYYDIPAPLRITWSFFYRLGFSLHLLMRLVHPGSMLQGGNFVVRREALLAIGGFNTKLDFYGEDVDIAKRIISVGRSKFTFRLPMYSSGRRLKKEGALLMGARYTLNYVWIMFFGRAFTKTYIDVRSQLLRKKKQRVRQEN